VPPRFELYRACATNEPGELVGGWMLCARRRGKQHLAARCGGRQAVTGDDAICQIGSLGNGAIEGPTTPIRHGHRRPTCLAHGWTCVAHVGDRAQKGPCADRTFQQPGFAFARAGCAVCSRSALPVAIDATARPSLQSSKTRRARSARRLEAREVPKHGERGALVALKLARLDGCVTTMLLTRRLSSRCIRTRTPRTRS
jgi:hypothetical protein